ncbi:YkvA family protein [Pseudomaricurvus sp.]|uniref:YkvA family protein n=1 Tax=Pseudomaricurvus sp. TaxID=2004510 RepID=UPI003F6BC175
MSDNPFENEFTDDGFWNKARKYARIAGESVLEPALKMYYAAQDPDTPAWARTTVYGALGYFITPIDAIPDISPFVGYSDDLGVLVAATAAIAAYIKKEHTDKAKAKLTEWFD